MMNWNINQASCIGKSHIDNNLPNQDAYVIKQDDNLGIKVCVVCDGAGSAKYAHDGSRYFSQQIALTLFIVGDLIIKNLMANKLSIEQLANDTPNNIQQAIILNINFIRANALTNLLKDSQDSLYNYHTTVIGILLLEKLNKALVFQLGDGNIIHSRFAVNNQHIDYFADIQISDTHTDSSAYVNETYFITQDDWEKHLHLNWIDVTDKHLLALMTDGCGDLVIAGGVKPKQIYRPFFANLIFNVLSTQAQHNQSKAEITKQVNHIMFQAIENPATYRLTSDDKTLILLIKNDGNSYAGIEPILDNPLKKTPQPISNTIDISTPMVVTTHNVPTTFEPIQHQFQHQSQDDTIKKNNQSNKRMMFTTLASLLLLVGLAVLTWLNQEILLQKLYQYKIITPATTAVSVENKQPVRPAPLPKLSAYPINHQLIIHNIQPKQSFLSTIMMLPKDVALADISQEKLVATVDNLSVMAKAQCSATTSPQIITDKIDFILPAHNQTKDWQYFSCKITLWAVNDKKQPTDLPTTTTKITLSTGFDSLVKKANNNPSNENSHSEPINLWIYYLPTSTQLDK